MTPLVRQVFTGEGVLVEYVDQDGHHYRDGKSWRVEPLTDGESAQVAAWQEADATPRPPTDAERINALEAVIVAMAKTAQVKDDPELAKAADELAAIEATRAREAPVVVEPLPDEPPVKVGR